MSVWSEYPEPTGELADPAYLLRRYLDYYHSELGRRLHALSPDAVRGTPLPTGWSPLHLALHLVHVEQRWIVWGFLGEQVSDPWGDADPPTLAWIGFHLLQEYA